MKWVRILTKIKDEKRSFLSGATSFHHKCRGFKRISAGHYANEVGTILLTKQRDRLMKEKNQDEEVFFPLELELDEILI